MAKAISMKDVIKCLAHLQLGVYKEFDLLPLSQDEMVKPILHELGMNIKEPFYIRAVKHRTLDDEVHLGYRYYGTIRADREWVNSKGCDIIERVAITSFSDLSLTRELCELMGKTVDLTEADGSFPMQDLDIVHDLIVPTYEEDSKMIKQLDDICFQVRGSLW